MSPRECQEPAGPQGSRLRETSWTLRLNEHAWKGWRRVCLGNLVEVPGSREGASGGRGSGLKLERIYWTRLRARPPSSLPLGSWACFSSLETHSFLGTEVTAGDLAELNAEPCSLQSIPVSCTSLILCPFPSSLPHISHQGPVHQLLHPLCRRRSGRAARALLG